jgi:4-diphosphocytidyl-2-C-methyl-D-erythritol kinase
VHEGSIRVFAPAKINLTLHITGQRADGYHLLDSLVAFADVGDWITITPKEAGLRLSGPEAQGLDAGAPNLIGAAARLFPGRFGFDLQKNLPVASGIGGGSADAAAACRGLTQLTGHRPASADILALGADVPVCVGAAPARMQGIGDQITPITGFPMFNAVLVNPRKQVSTAKVFAGLKTKDGAPMPGLPPITDPLSVIEWLGTQHNDLEHPALRIEPSIGEVIEDLTKLPGCLLARMSGSGATCFGLFPDRAQAAVAAQSLGEHHPDWWVRPCTLGDQSKPAGTFRL